MTYRTMISGLSALAFAGSGLAGDWQIEFDAMDANSDGVVTEAEFVADRTADGAITEEEAQNTFAVIAGTDGALMPDEFAAARDQMTGAGEDAHDPATGLSDETGEHGPS